VAEEVRFFLRTALYTIGITIVYWFISYEIAGSVLLLSLGLSAIFFVFAGAVMIHHNRREVVPDRTKSGNPIKRTVGFEEEASETVTPPLSFEEEAVPTSSIWPLVAAVGALGMGLGLVYGGWLWAPGVMLATVAVWGWVTQLNA
jgi:hypothetical protein